MTTKKPSTEIATVDTPTVDAEVITKNILGKREARALDNQIREAVKGTVIHVAYIEALLEDAEKRQIHKALGYDNWAGYIAATVSEMFGNSDDFELSDTARKKLIGVLGGAGMSIRAMAKALGVSKDKVHRELSQSATPRPTKTTGLDGKQQPSRKPKQTKPEPITITYHREGIPKPIVAAQVRSYKVGEVEPYGQHGEPSLCVEIVPKGRRIPTYRRITQGHRAEYLTIREGEKLAYDSRTDIPVGEPKPDVLDVEVVTEPTPAEQPAIARLKDNERRFEEIAGHTLGEDNSFSEVMEGAILDEAERRDALRWMEITAGEFLGAARDWRDKFTATGVPDELELIHRISASLTEIQWAVAAFAVKSEAAEGKT